MHERRVLVHFLWVGQEACPSLAGVLLHDIVMVCSLTAGSYSQLLFIAHSFWLLVVFEVEVGFLVEDLGLWLVPDVSGVHQHPLPSVFLVRETIVHIPNPRGFQISDLVSFLLINMLVLVLLDVLLVFMGSEVKGTFLICHCRYLWLLLTGTLLLFAYWQVKQVLHVHLPLLHTNFSLLVFAFNCP